MKKNDIIKEKDAPRVAKSSKIFIIGLSLMLALVLVFGIVVGTVAAVRDSRAVVKYGGTAIDAGVASYLAATYKAAFMRDVKDAYDIPEFWASEFSGGLTMGEVLEQRALEYIKSVVVGAYLFDRYSSFTKEEKEALSRACREVLDYKAGGSEESFNDECRDMGFDYSDFEKATELIYKSELAKSVIYGEGGAALKTGERYGECDAYYYNEYAHVKILYIPTFEKLITDKDGKLVLNSDGYYKTEYYTVGEIEERRADIARIRELILGYENDLDEQINPVYFDTMQEKYNINLDFLDTGYYFSPYSAYAANFAEDSSERLPTGYKEAFYKMMDAVVYSSLSISVGQYNEIEGDYGIAFIYKYDNEEYGYLSSVNAAQFHDFFSDAADYLYAQSVKEISKDVLVREGYSKISLIDIPYNYDFIATLG